MLRLLSWLFNGHFHKWKTILVGNVKWAPEDGGGNAGQRFTVQCEICGRIKYYKNYSDW